MVSARPGGHNLRPKSNINSRPPWIIPSKINSHNNGINSRPPWNRPTKINSRNNGIDNRNNKKPRIVTNTKTNTYTNTYTNTTTTTIRTNPQNNKYKSRIPVPVATTKRGQAIICPGRSAVKHSDTITTISATRRNTTSAGLKPLPHSPQIVSGIKPRLAPLHVIRQYAKPQTQNGALMFKPILKAHTGRMGRDNFIDHPTTANNRPQMSSVSTTAARGMNRAPLAPKITSASKQSQLQTSGLACVAATATTTRAPTTSTTTTAPLAKRARQRPGSFIGTIGSSSRTQNDDDRSTVSTAFNSHPSSTVSTAFNSHPSSTVSTAFNSHPSSTVSTAFNPHLISVATSRSASRQIRADSTNCTPNGTPNPDRHENWDAKSGFHPSSPLSQGDSRRPIVTFTAVSPKRAPLRQDGTDPRDSKFFHANDVKAKASSKSLKNTGSAFIHANGSDHIQISTTNPAPLLPALSPKRSQSQEKVSSKFMYANGTPEVPAMPPTTLSRKPSSTTKGSTVGSAVATQRSTVPSKQPRHASSHRNSTGSQSSSVNTNTATTAAAHVRPPPPQLGPSPPGLRRSGTATPRSSDHSRAGSLVKEESSHETLKPMASPITSFFPPTNNSSSQPTTITLASIIQKADEMSDPEDEAPSDESSGPQSPTKSTVPSADPVSDLVANARRERRIQDLEIRNGSLEAINRTLERQLRKQSAELRRFRRLSRAGNLPLASTTMSSREASGTMSEEEEAGSLGQFDLSGEDQLIKEDLKEESLSDTDSMASDVNSSVQDARDAKCGQQDEQRLTVDLSKHRQILIDSQKINQSIRRCLDWTELLIEDARKALEYRVQSTDVRLGGRVLNPLDEEEYTGTLPPNGLGTFGTESMGLPSEVLTTWSAEPQDRDSGIEMLKDGE